jgi:DNA-binding MarR family transcriptional regulator
MMNSNKESLFRPSEPMRELQLLDELEKNPSVSQRELSNKFGIALGLTNACIKRMVRRGWIRLKEVPPRRFGYYLTPKGFAEKSKLTLTYLAYNIHHYGRLKTMISETFAEMASQGVKRVIFYGVSDEMEVAYIILQGTGMELVAIVDDRDRIEAKNVLGRRVIQPGVLNDLEADAVLITSILDKERILKDLKKKRNRLTSYTIS